MYNDIINSFLNNIRAIRFYISSVDQTMDRPWHRELVGNKDSVLASMIYYVAKAQQRGINLLESPSPMEDMPEEIVGYIKEIERIVQEIESDGNNVYFHRYLPKGVKEEYQKLEAIEKQKEILYRGSLLLLVTYFENLIAGVMRESFIKYPQRISLDEKSVSYKILAEMNDIEEIKNILIDQEVTNKMYESLLDWKKYFQKNLKLNLKAWEDEFEVIQEIIARRNLYVHNNGIVNNIYIKLVNGMKKDSVGDRLNIDREYIDNAIDIIEYVGMSLVLETWLKECGDNQDDISNILGIIYEEYLEMHRWKMAQYFYEICLKSQKLLDADRILCKINNWQCYKWLGEYDKVKDEVEKLDISAYQPKYILGVLALGEDYERFFEFYDSQTDIGEAELKEWPLFMKLRTCEEYMRRFPEMKVEEKEEIECNGNTKDVVDG